MEQVNPLNTSDIAPDFDGVCRNVRVAFEPARVHAVSLHDEKGDLLWLTESSMGPDEHNAVREAFDAFASANGPPILNFDLGDARSAVLFRAVSSRRTLAGAIMVIMDTRGIPQGPAGAARLMTPKLQRALTEFAAMRPGTIAATAPQTAAAALERRTAPRVPPEIDRLHAALRRSPIALHVQRLVPLTKGSQLKRYEVLLRSKSPCHRKIPLLRISN